MNRGIVIGGPSDGRMIEAPGEVWSYHKTPESLTRPVDYSNVDDVRAAAQVTSEVGTYYFTSMAYFGHSDHQRFGFWVERDKTLNDALAALLARYQKPREQMSLLKRAGHLLYHFARGGGLTEKLRETRDVLHEIKEITDEG